MDLLLCLPPLLLLLLGAAAGVEVGECICCAWEPGASPTKFPCPGGLGGDSGGGERGEPGDPGDAGGAFFPFPFLLPFFPLVPNMCFLLCLHLQISSLLLLMMLCCAFAMRMATFSSRHRLHLPVSGVKDLAVLRSWNLTEGSLPSSFSFQNRVTEGFFVHNSCF